MTRRCVAISIATVIAIAIALGVGLGVGLRDDSEQKTFVYGNTRLTGMSASEWNADANAATRFKRGVATLSTMVSASDVTVTSVTDVARRRAARRLLASNSKVDVAFSIATRDAAARTSVKTTLEGTTATVLKDALVAEGLAVSAVTVVSVAVDAPAPAPTPTPTTTPPTTPTPTTTPPTTTPPTTTPPTTPTPPPASGVLTGTARQNAFAAAVSTSKISLLPPQGIVTSSSSARVDGRVLAAVEQPINVSSFAADADYNTQPEATTYVNSITDEVFATANMILCFISSTNWTQNLNTGAYVAELDPYHCENSEGNRIKGQITYRWVVNATGPNLDDPNDPLVEFRANVWIHLSDHPEMPFVDTQIVVKREDVVVKKSKVFVKKLAFTYKNGAATIPGRGVIGSGAGMKGVLIQECAIGAGDADCTSRSLTWYQAHPVDREVMRAKSITENGITKATFAATGDDEDSFSGKMVTSPNFAKLEFRNTTYCDKMSDRAYFGEEYVAYDVSGKKVRLQSFANLKATGTDNATYHAFMSYPGNLYVSEYDDEGDKLDKAEKASASAAFMDGKSVTEIVDWNDPSKDVNFKLKISRGVLYKKSNAIQPASNYKDAPVIGWLWNSTINAMVEIKFVYDSSSNKIMLTSKKQYSWETNTLANNTISTPRALTMDDINSEPLGCYGSIFGQGSAILLNLTHFKVAKAETITPGSLPSNLTLTCSDNCVNASTFATLNATTDHQGSMMYAQPNGYGDGRSTYKTFTFDKDTAKLTDDSGSNREVVLDVTNDYFKRYSVWMTLFEATDDHVAKLGCSNVSKVCQHPSALDEYYEWRSSWWDGMAWLEDPNNATKKKFMQAPLALQGQMPTTASAIPRTPSGTNYAGTNLNLQYEGGWIDGLPQVCLNPGSGDRTAPEYDQWGYARCDRRNGYFQFPDVVLPDGITLEDPSTSPPSKYVLKLSEGVELLQRANASQCASMSFDDAIQLPEASAFVDFVMPTKPNATTLMVKSTDKE